MDTIKEIKQKLTYNNKENFLLLKDFLEQDRERENNGGQSVMDKAEKVDLYRMLSRAMEIQYFQSNWMNFDVSELDGKRYILDEEYAGKLFGLEEEKVIALNNIFKKADSGDVTACLYLAEKLMEGFFSEAMTVYASRYWKIAAEKGDVSAMYNLGMSYRWGEYGEFADPEQALFWFRKAADRGNEEAKEILTLFDSEEGKRLLLQSAISGTQGYGSKWYKSKIMVDEYFKGADDGDAEMQYELARESVPGHKFDVFKRQPENAVKYYEMAAEQGMIDAMFNLANLCEEGCPGFEPDIGKAFSWRKKCADAGDGEACFLLGKMYQEGRGVTEDMQMAKEYFSRAYEAGFDK